MAPGGSGDLHWGIGGNAAVVGRVDNDRPPVALPRHFADRHAVGSLSFDDVIGVPGHRTLAVPVHQVEVGVFVVDGQDHPAVAHKQLHAVAIVAERQLLAGAGAATLLVERRA